MRFHMKKHIESNMELVQISSKMGEYKPRYLWKCGQATQQKVWWIRKNWSLWSQKIETKNQTRLKFYDELRVNFMVILV